MRGSNPKRLCCTVFWSALILSILFLTGSRSMWINIGPISIQPSEFMKPVFCAIVCNLDSVNSMRRKRFLLFYVSKETLILTGAFIVIVGLQWWCRDLGSLPTFAAAYGCAMVCRLCYPKAKFSKKTVIVLCVIGVALDCIGSTIRARLCPGSAVCGISGTKWRETVINSAAH